MPSSALGLHSDEHFMRQALLLAEQAFQEDEVPIGAVVVCNNRIIGRGYNQVERLHDATAHAEMLAITAASDFLGSNYLEGCTLYVTIEPCPMCAGALRWVQLERVVFGAAEPKFGYSRFGQEMLHPKTEVVSGIFAEESRQLMRSFFQQKRGLEPQ
jgi:tRNA(adenine34) deaminase